MLKTNQLAQTDPKEISPGDVGLFVATDLNCWGTDRAAAFSRDVQVDDTVYRRLDPEYFAWLRSRMTLAKEAAGAGKLDLAEFGELRSRFAAIEAWALDHLGPQALLAAIRALEPRQYAPPKSEADRRRSQYLGRGEERIKRAITLIDAIREQALALGWRPERLYQHEGFLTRPFAAEYGLVCHISLQDEIGEVTHEAIEIVGPPPRGKRLHFYNPDADQPWTRRL